MIYDLTLQYGMLLELILKSLVICVKKENFSSSVNVPNTNKQPIDRRNQTYRIFLCCYSILIVVVSTCAYIKI